MSASIENGVVSSVNIRPMEERDLLVADRVMRVAFGTFIGLPEPAAFMGDATFIPHRWKADPSGAFVAEHEGEVIGSNLATNWGSVGFFGPLTIRPDFWDRKVGRQLIEPAMECFAKWGNTHTGLFTFSASPKHAALYQRFGFWPRFLLAIMGKPVEGAQATAATGVTGRWRKYSGLSESEKEAALRGCRALTDGIYPGLDVTMEIQAVDGQSLGETLLVGDGPDAFAVCHFGPGTEGGSGTCYVKFGAAASSQGVEGFGRLLDAVEAFAGERGLPKIFAGVSTARHEAYQAMLRRGFRTEIQGVCMHRPNEDGYHRPGVFVLDDWR
jgi:GNAT superfamily N-acetyltransferase